VVIGQEEVMNPRSHARRQLNQGWDDVRVNLEPGLFELPQAEGSIVRTVIEKQNPDWRFIPVRDYRARKGHEYPAP
jgi:hypothetical protein